MMLLICTVVFRLMDTASSPAASRCMAPTLTPCTSGVPVVCSDAFSTTASMTER